MLVFFSVDQIIPFVVKQKTGRMTFSGIYILTVILIFVGEGQAQQFFRSTSDSIKYRKTVIAISDTLFNNPRADTYELTRLAESYIVKDIPRFKKGYYAFYNDLMQSNRPDTIRHIGLYNLRIRRIPRQVFKCKNLTELDISGCKIRRLPNALNDLKRLEILVINKSKLRRLKIDVSENNSIKELDLAYNNLKKIPIDLIKLKSMEYLNISGNKVKRIPKFLSDCEKLTAINLSFNRVRDNDLELTTNLHIRSLNLSHNKLTDIPFTLSSFSNLEELSLSYNKIKIFRTKLGTNGYRY
ncbi:leucine-rich repeat domain-containing protein [Chryseolinea sp. H1M3-3]|uniref:leucine-rich repeat domain-containing protein n=1 Tax=Chryseolinea sp. H1M3-3 TaxID=3034144 RepID=UPI0023EBEEB5|nr:leucine-rich repeat domain-containing protein [Chryseolinea sp. H1M3-3]